MKRFWLKVWSGLNYVWPYQLVIYIGLFAWGLGGLFRPQVTPVSVLMTGVAYNTWLILHLAAPTLTWLGQWMQRRHHTPKRELQGWELQWIGDTAVCLIAATTSYAFWQVGDITAFDEFLQASFAMSTVFVAMLVLHDSIAVVYQWVYRRPIPGADVR